MNDKPVDQLISRAMRKLARRKWDTMSAEEREAHVSRLAQAGAASRRVETPCARCGVVCPSRRAADAHCRKPRKKD